MSIIKICARAASAQWRGVNQYSTGRSIPLCCSCCYRILYKLRHVYSLYYISSTRSKMNHIDITQATEFNKLRDNIKEVSDITVSLIYYYNKCKPITYIPQFLIVIQSIELHIITIFIWGNSERCITRCTFFVIYIYNPMMDISSIQPFYIFFFEFWFVSQAIALTFYFKHNITKHWLPSIALFTERGIYPCQVQIVWRN